MKGLKLPKAVAYQFDGEKAASFFSTNKLLKHDYVLLSSVMPEDSINLSAQYSSKKSKKEALKIYNERLKDYINEFTKKHKCKEVIIIWRVQPKFIKHIFLKKKLATELGYSIMSRLVLLPYNMGLGNNDK